MFFVAENLLYHTEEMQKLKKDTVINVENEYYPFVNTPLNYTYDALEPNIDAKTMELHHNRHLQKYIDELNKVLEENPRLQALSLDELVRIAPNLPVKIRDDVRNNAGGVYNHRMFFDGIAPAENFETTGALGKAILKKYGNFDSFYKSMADAAMSVFGSGYAWLVLGKNGLETVITHNQDTPLSRGMCPIIALDVWEHAYYLKHYNDRRAYIDDLFRVIDWSAANKRYTQCIQRHR